MSKDTHVAEVTLNDRGEFRIYARCEACNGCHDFSLDQVVQVISDGYLVWVDFICSRTDSCMRTNEAYARAALNEIGRNVQALTGLASFRAVLTGEWLVNTMTGALTQADNTTSHYGVSA